MLPVGPFRSAYNTKEGEHMSDYDLIIIFLTILALYNAVDAKYRR